MNIYLHKSTTLHPNTHFENDAHLSTYNREHSADRSTVFGNQSQDGWVVGEGGKQLQSAFLQREIKTEEDTSWRL